MLKDKTKFIILCIILILIVLFMIWISSNTMNIILTTYIICIISYLLLSMILMFLIMSNRCKKCLNETFCSKNKILLFIVVIVILTFSLTFINIKVLENIIENNNVVIDISQIDLNEYDKDLIINNSGEYLLSGEFKHTIYIDSRNKVILFLDNVSIDNSNGPCIVNRGTSELVISLIDGTTNTLSADGKNDYNGCIYSNGNLTIDGHGNLSITSSQKSGEGISTINKNININGGNITVKSKDDGINAGGDNGGTITINDGTIFVNAKGDGIDSNNNMIINGGIIYSMGSSKGGDAALDTDNGFSINGGTVVAIGSDMLELPQEISKQYSICFELNEIPKNTLVTLLNDKDQIIISFEAKEKFKTLIISSNKITKGKYHLYIDGSNSGTQNNYIYENGKYTKGTKILDINVEKNITNIKSGL